MTTLASLMKPVVDEVSAPLRASFEPVLTELAHVPTDVVAFEAANKSLPTIRKRAEHFTLSVLTKGGRAQASDTSTVVISMGHLVKLIGQIIEAVETEAGERRPADAILNDLIAIKGDGRSIDIGVGRYEETVGGHMRF